MNNNNRTKSTKTPKHPVSQPGRQSRAPHHDSPQAHVTVRSTEMNSRQMSIHNQLIKAVNDGSKMARKRLALCRSLSSNRRLFCPRNRPPVEEGLRTGMLSRILSAGHLSTVPNSAASNRSLTTVCGCCSGWRGCGRFLTTNAI